MQTYARLIDYMIHIFGNKNRKHVPFFNTPQHYKYKANLTADKLLLEKKLAFYL